MTLLGHLLAIAALGALCGGWVAVQRWVSRLDPEAPGVEGSGSCGGLRAECGECGAYAPARPSDSLAVTASTIPATSTGLDLCSRSARRPSSSR